MWKLYCLVLPSQFGTQVRGGGSGGIGRLPPTGQLFLILIIGAILIRLVIKPPVRSRLLQKQQNQDPEPEA
jgi:hypothetical protein